MNDHGLYTVKEAAELAGVSVRTLHYYDQTGLLNPERKNSYRIYRKKDLEILQQILFFRELDFSLAEIMTILKDPRFSRKAALMEQRRKLKQRRLRIDRLIQTIDKWGRSLRKEQTS